MPHEREDTMRNILISVTAMVLLSSTAAMAAEMKADQAKVVGAEISTISGHLANYPNTAIDFSKVSGEYCFDTGLGAGGHMTHYAIDPTGTHEDVIDFINAAPLIKAGVVDVESLPNFPGTLGSMKHNQWYYLAANELEPHHGKKLPFPLLMKASDHQ
jgi:hypothetical protein